MCHDKIMTGTTNEQPRQTRKDQRDNLAERKEDFRVGVPYLVTAALGLIKKWGNPEGLGVCTAMRQLGTAGNTVVNNCIDGPPRAKYLRNIGSDVCNKCPIYDTCNFRVEAEGEEGATVTE